MSEITFLGGVGTVTGSKFLVKTQGKKILVDCGLFQGVKEQRLLNREPFPIEPASIDAILLTHAHLDHTGYLPVLVKNGFSGPIYCSAPTIELTRVILLDSARIQMEDADDANEKEYSVHKPALPLYDTDDAQKVFPLMHSLSTDEWHAILPGILDLRLSNSGHIMGSCFLELMIQGKRIVFSGDLGRESPLLLHKRATIESADTLILESTYGDRLHDDEDPCESLRKIIQATWDQGGTVLIPAFAIGRAQEVLYIINRLKAEKKIPSEIPVFLDSPMADRVTRSFDRFPTWHKLNPTELDWVTDFYEKISSPAESYQLVRSKKPCIIIAGSGMLNGGRIRQHLEHRITDPKHSIVLVGYQAAGTPGRFLQNFSKELKLFGRYLPVKIKIHQIDSLSAHADQMELIRWVQQFKSLPNKIILVHGEAQATEGLRVRLKDETGIKVIIPKMGDTVNLQ